MGRKGTEVTKLRREARLVKVEGGGGLSEWNAAKSWGIAFSPRVGKVTPSENVLSVVESPPIASLSVHSFRRIWKLRVGFGKHIARIIFKPVSSVCFFVIVSKLYFKQNPLILRQAVILALKTKNIVKTKFGYIFLISCCSIFIILFVINILET